MDENRNCVYRMAITCNTKILNFTVTKKKHVLAHSKNYTGFLYSVSVHGKNINIYISVVAIAVPIQKCCNVNYIENVCTNIKIQVIVIIK